MFRQFVPELTRPAARMRTLSTFVAAFALSLGGLIFLNRQNPFFALCFQLALYTFVYRWLHYFFSPWKGHTYYQAFWRVITSGAVTLASVTFILFSTEDYLLPNPDRLIPVWAALPAGLYLGSSGFGMMVRVPLATPFATLIGLPMYFPEAGQREKQGLFAAVRHPGYGGLARVAFSLALGNGSALSALFACIFVLGWQPIWVGLEEQELVARFGEAYKAYGEKVPALFPGSLREEVVFLKAILGR